MKDIDKPRPFREDDIEVDLTKSKPRWIKDELGHLIRIVEVYEGAAMVYYATMKIDKTVFEHNDWRSVLRHHLVELCPGIRKYDGRSFLITNPKKY